ncbi:MAG: hypothetical protein M1825_004472 [Sarcosagium campestre]|nr:MAG: hypothetical protein M1825_004472 [Sarcosagium campestre]
MLRSATSPYICKRCAASTYSFPFRHLQRQNHIQHGPIPRQRPLRLAIIGSGPAGFYTASKVMSRLHDCKIDMYEKLPVPFGLVRFGVAPDHPEVKDKFTSVARSANFTFIGNVTVGSDVLPLSKLKEHYDAIVFAYGASHDRQLGIAGETTLRGVYSARAFVGWYDALPEFADLAPDLQAGDEAVVIGQGNVALDVARVLLTDVDALRKTDIADHALDALAKSRVRRVTVVGRRGPMQAAFTIKEVRELMDLPSVAFDPIDPALLPSDPSKLPRAAKRLTQLLSRGSQTSTSSASQTPNSSASTTFTATTATAAAAATKSWALRFLLSPTAFTPSSTDTSHLGGITFQPTCFTTNDTPFSASARTVPDTTADRITISAPLAFRSIGYKAVPLPGLSDLSIPFDDSLGIIPNDTQGRILLSSSIVSLGNHSSPTPTSTPTHIPGLYVAGWAKRGPTGVIASTMEDAFMTAEAIVQDWESGAAAAAAAFLNHDHNGDGEGGGRGGWESLRHGVEARGVRWVSWRDWEKIDRVERERGRSRARERVKIASVHEMLSILD